MGLGRAPEGARKLPTAPPIRRGSNGRLPYFASNDPDLENIGSVAVFSPGGGNEKSFAAGSDIEGA